MGDFNARVGSNGAEESVVGKYGYGDRDEMGQKLIDFCADHSLVLTNTLFRHRMRRRYTWKQAGDRSRSMILMVPGAVRSRSGEDCSNRPGKYLDSVRRKRQIWAT